jgi:hypothetical protein
MRDKTLLFASIPQEFMKLLIVILNYKTTALAIDCLRSLAAERLLELGGRVTLVDNASGDNAPELLRRAIAENGWAAWVDLLANPRNLGFTGGNNCAIEPALSGPDAPEYVLLLNSDTVVQPGAISALLDFMHRTPAAGIASSCLLAPTGERQASAFRFPGVLSEFDLALRLGPVSKLLQRWQVVMPMPEQPCRADWVPGASMILRSKMLHEVGLLDEGYFTYFEDLDLCWRAHAKNWQTWYVPQSRVVHLAGAASGISSGNRKRRPEYWHQARRRFLLLQYGPRRAVAIDLACLLGTALWRIRRWLQRKPDTDPPHLLHDTWINSVMVKGFEIPDVVPPSG